MIFILINVLACLDGLGGCVGEFLTPQKDRWIGLAIVRREIEEDELVDAAGAAAEIVHLPFDLLT